MSSTESPISITVKTPNNSLVTVRAGNGEELDVLVANALDSLVSAVTELESAVRGVQPPAPSAAQAVHNLVSNMGASVEQVISNNPGMPGSGSRVCPHGTMTRIHGLTGKFGSYKGFFCPAKQGDPTKCTTQYVKAGDPAYDNFVADQVKQ